MTLKEHDEWKEDNHGHRGHSRAKTHNSGRAKDDTDTYRQRREDEEQNRKKKDRDELF